MEQEFIKKHVKEIKDQVNDNLAINALSGGVDSSTVTMLGHKALGDKMLTYFIDNGLMREGEPEKVVNTFEALGIRVRLIDAKHEFFTALKGITDPEEKREAITQTFYKDVFSKLVHNSGAKYLFQGTILTDIDETIAGIKRQHNVFKQIGINPEETFGYKIIEPLVELRKDGVRLVAKAIGLPEEIYNRQPFPGPALVARVIGPITQEKIELIRKVTTITELALVSFKHFQSMAILHEDKVTGIVNNERRFGHVIQLRCWESIDARKATPVALPWKTLFEIGERIPAEIPGVTQVTYNLTSKPPVTMEAI